MENDPCTVGTARKHREGEQAEHFSPSRGAEHREFMSPSRRRPIFSEPSRGRREFLEPSLGSGLRVALADLEAIK